MKIKMLFGCVLLLTLSVVIVYFAKSQKQIINPTESVSLTSNSIQSITVPDKKEGYIEGKIIISYNIPEYPNIDNDITIAISSNEAKENYYDFGVTLCKKEADNCIWFISKLDKTQTYGYKLTRDGINIIMSGNIYKLFVNSRIFNNTGNVGDARETKIVEIPSTGVLIQDFNLTATGYSN